MDGAEADQALAKAFRRPRGRPVKTRHLAARALGLKRVNKDRTWRSIADELRPSDYPKDAEPFRKRLRRDVTRLRNFLRQAEDLLNQP